MKRQIVVTLVASQCQQPKQTLRNASTLQVLSSKPKQQLACKKWDAIRLLETWSSASVIHLKTSTKFHMKSQNRSAMYWCPSKLHRSMTNKANKKNQLQSIVSPYLNRHGSLLGRSTIIFLNSASKTLQSVTLINHHNSSHWIKISKWQRRMIEKYFAQNIESASQ